MELPPQVPQPMLSVKFRPLSKPPPLPKVCAWLISTRTTSVSCASLRARAMSLLCSPTEWPRP